MSVRVELWYERLNSGDIDAVELLQDVSELEREIEKGEAAIQELRGGLEGMKQDLAALMGLRNFVVHAAPGPGKPLLDAMRDATDGARGTKRQAILTLLRSVGHPLPIRDIRDALVDAGAIQNTPGAYHALQVTLSQMFRDGQLGRPRQGLYELSPVGAI